MLHICSSKFLVICTKFSFHFLLSAVTSFAFSPGAVVTYTQREAYHRDQLIAQQSRVKRSSDSHVISLTFITKVKDGSLFYSRAAKGYMQIYVSLMGQITLVTLMTVLVNM